MNKDKQTQDYLKLLSESHRQISSYIFSMVSNFEDANDIFQETVGIMWKKFDEFEPGTNFTSWGIKIAHYQILSYRRKKGTQKVFFSDRIFAQIDEVATQRCTQTDTRLKYLRECINKLKPADRDLLQRRYELNCTIKKLASRAGRSIQYLYKHLAKIQHILHTCINRRIMEQDV